MQVISKILKINTIMYVDNMMMIFPTDVAIFALSLLSMFCSQNLTPIIALQYFQAECH